MNQGEFSHGYLSPGHQTRESLTASQKIANYASRFDVAQVRGRHMRLCIRAIADTHAVAIAGRNEAASQAALRYIGGLAAAGTAGQVGMASLWGRSDDAPVELAALYNGIAAHVLDYDDVTSPMNGHPSVALLPALLALAEARDLSGQHLAAAYIVGFEVICKLGKSLDAEHFRRGWHMTASIGIIACAVACAKILELDAPRIAHAIGLAVAQTAGTRENFGTDAKAFQAGNCGAAGLRAALLAEAGFTASANALDGPTGYTALYSQGEDLGKELDRLGELPLEIERSGIEVKKYPTCYATHRPLDAMFALMQEHDIDLQVVEHVLVETSQTSLTPLIRHHPRTGIEGKFSMQYTLAAALSDGRIGLSSFTDEAVQRPHLQSWFERIEAREAQGASLPRWASLTVMLKDGRTLHRHVETLRGAAEAPLSHEELMLKLDDCLRFGGSVTDAEALYKTLPGLGLQRIRATMRQLQADCQFEKELA